MVLRKHSVDQIIYDVNVVIDKRRILKSTPYVVSTIFFERLCAAGTIGKINYRFKQNHE